MLGKFVFVFVLVADCYSGVWCKGLIFDVFRNSSAKTSGDICTRLTCSTKANKNSIQEIQQIISMTVLEKYMNQGGEKPLATLSFFDSDIHVYGGSEKVLGKGRLLAKEGELTVYLKGLQESCLSGMFSCELRFINNKSKGEVIRVDKKLDLNNQGGKKSESKQLDNNVATNLQDLLSEEFSKIRKQAENVTQNIDSSVKEMTNHLRRVEERIDVIMKSRFDLLEQKLNNLQTIFSEQVQTKLEQVFTEVIHRSTDSIMEYIKEGFNYTLQQIVELQSTEHDRISSTENEVPKTFVPFSASNISCEALPSNLSSVLYRVEDNLSSFKTEVLEKLSAADTQLESSDELGSTRLIMETLVRMDHNMSAAERIMSRMKSDLSRDITAVRMNISSLNENIDDKHNRFTREVIERMNNFEEKLTRKFTEFESRGNSFGSLDREIKGKLVNIELTLKNIKVAINGFRSIFG